MSTAIGSILESPASQDLAKPTVGARPALTVLDLLTLLAGRWRLLAKAALVGAVAGLALAFLLPTRYTAVTTILPPSSSSSLASLFAAQSGELGAVAGFTGGNFGFRSPAEICLIMLRSRTVEDATIQRFELMREYGKKRVSDARTALERRTSVTLNMKSGMIAISATDGNAARAAELANGYVDEFKKFSASLAITEASQRRLFFEQQLLEARGTLTQAEEALKNTQQTTRMLEPAGASKALLESAVAIRAQVAAKQVQLRSMRTYATEENPRLIQVKQETAALESQLAELTGTSPESVDDPLVPKGDMPEAGAEYLRRLRDVKYNESVVALLARQLEIARLDEARQGAVIQVVDLAITPDKRSSPKRLAILFASIFLAFCSASFWVLYASRDTNLPITRAASNVTALLLALLAMTQFMAAQTPENPGQSASCSTSAEGSQGTPCFDPQQSASAVPSIPQNQEDGSKIWTNVEQSVRDAHRNAEGASPNLRKASTGAQSLRKRLSLTRSLSKWLRIRQAGRWPSSATLCLQSLRPPLHRPAMPRFRAITFWGPAMNCTFEYGARSTPICASRLTAQGRSIFHMLVKCRLRASNIVIWTAISNRLSSACTRTSTLRRLSSAFIQFKSLLSDR